MQQEALLIMNGELLSSYIKMRDKYLSNSEKLSGKGEFRKASELLWGAVTQAIKALAAAHERKISAHIGFFEFMRKLAEEVEDPELYRSFLFLRDLHKNFYDETIAPIDFQIYRKEAHSFIKKLNEIMRSSSIP